MNWDWFGEKIRNAKRPVKVLNLFAYTGGATLAAAAAGASVTHVDASKGMVTWAKENAAASGLSEAPIRWLVDDCVKFVEREIRRGNKYDAIIMDPPSYGRGPKGEVWQIEEKLYGLVELCTKVLSDEPLFFLINSYTTGLSPIILEHILDATVAKNLAMQVASMAPKYVSQAEVPSEEVEHERELQLQMMKADPNMASKPEKVLVGILKGKVDKHFKDQCLLDKEYFLEPKTKVSQFLKDNKAEVVTFVRFQTGEGIEKREENFAEEVAAQMAK